MLRMFSGPQEVEQDTNPLDGGPGQRRVSHFKSTMKSWFLQLLPLPGDGVVVFSEAAV